MKKEQSEKENLSQVEKRIKIYKKVMIGLDILALVVLVLQIIAKDVSYSSYVLLILCNVLVFVIKPNKEDMKK